MNENKTILDVKDLVVELNAKKWHKVHAVSGVSFQIARGETLGLVGESGCGKTTLARAIMHLTRPTSGKVLFRGEDLTQVGKEHLRKIRPLFQMIFQDPISSLNPRRKVGETIATPLRIIGKGDKTERSRRSWKMMEAVGLDPAQAFNRRPFQFSAGQCQRISIARALMTEPELLICDEPVSALDVSVQAQIINLLKEMRERYGLTMLFISHDLAVVKNVCDRVAVMYLGKLCEIATSERLYRAPRHPYTDALLRAIPRPDPRQPQGKAEVLAGELPSPTDPPSGCRFHTRCPYAKERCAELEPQLNEIEPGHHVACHFPI